MSEQLAANEYRCAMCKNVYTKGWPEDEAQAESQQYWPNLQPNDREVVCDDCWQKIRPDEHPVEYQESLLEQQQVPFMEFNHSCQELEWVEVMEAMRKQMIDAFHMPHSMLLDPFQPETKDHGDLDD